jgi:hypothetical protein
MMWNTKEKTLTQSSNTIVDKSSWVAGFSREFCQLATWMPLSKSALPSCDSSESSLTNSMFSDSVLASEPSALDVP